ncbi:MAG: PHB depolymerase family esterase [Deltaproteobacteria bacterium]|nr:PHB depolymerase family esterase [Myxococcales bacterium]MDP3218240.1 PHB depolymerase family esterase [Deltaproteobacteria bacterium]
MNTRVALTLCLLGASGCEVVPADDIDAGAMSLIVDAAPDRGVARDTPRAPDAPVPDRPGTAPDVPPPPDAAPPTDLGAARDAGLPRDVGVAFDAGVPRDVGVDAPISIDIPACIYEAVFRDSTGEPRNAAGQVRHCWPGEARCFCDRDNDCYAEAGYVPRCTPGVADAGTPRVDVGTPRDVGSPIDVGTPRDVPVVVDVTRDTGTIPADDPVVYTGTLPTRTGRSAATIRVNGNARDVTVYVPASRGAAPPLLLLFHGTNGSGAGVFDESDAQAVANANGAIVLAPSSRYRSSGDWDHRTEETYWETYPNGSPTANEDLVLTRALIVEARRAYGVDAGRVYALGHSNGAFFATLVASALADRIAAYATSSGGLNRCASTWSCSFEGSGSTCATLRTRPGWCACSGAEKPVALRTDGRMPPGYLAHGTRDPLVSVQYTCELEARMAAVGAVTQTALRDGDGHVLPSDFVSAAWRFLGPRRR